jgi:hypothetical protein
MKSAIFTGSAINAGSEKIIMMSNGSEGRLGGKINENKIIYQKNEGRKKRKESGQSVCESKSELLRLVKCSQQSVLKKGEW